ncbi:MAG: lysophospholipid acyltransferase family protein [Gammaproteobacteria bacterium]|nr:lysophospholipid acyltransferase family protein [Gammaproteobacteria bacterium]
MNDEMQQMIPGSPRNPLLVGQGNQSRLKAGMGVLANRMLGLTRLDARYRSLPAGGDTREFLGSILRALSVTYNVEPQTGGQLPVSGQCIVVCNHPFGGLDGVIIAHYLLGLRPDLKIVANGMLSRIAELKDLLIDVDPFAGIAPVARNIAGARHAAAWLRQGGMLLMFPAGEVAHYHPRLGQVTDPRWKFSFARLARNCGASVVVAGISGRNSNVFQLGGMLHPRLRTALLPRELLNKDGVHVDVCVSSAVASNDIPSDRSHQDRGAFFRAACDGLTADAAASGTAVRRFRLRKDKAAAVVDIRTALHPSWLAAEVEALPDSARLVTQGELVVCCAESDAIPCVMQEIGRLREATFRGVGEGTSRSTDVDRYDPWYQQLFIWNSATRQVIGGYRIGDVSAIAARRGVAGLYTSSLFALAPKLVNSLAPAIELGRSFVRPEAQKNYLPLFLLWRGIGAYIARTQDKYLLLGPVSISNSYRRFSREIIVRYLCANHFDDQHGSQVTPRRPFRTAITESLSATSLHGLDVAALNRLISAYEPDGRGIPILLRHYLKLGGRILGFNVDPLFGQALDCLLTVDLRAVGRTTLEKYMGPAAVAEFIERHADG